MHTDAREDPRPLEPARRFSAATQQGNGFVALMFDQGYAIGMFMAASGL
jgi:hypothetical protein